ncbi:MAG TPA: hypothetical protein DCY20_03485 [Firmicutes bacterium]|nr:hypothetical protein [Bacillota bacterium]
MADSILSVRIDEELKKKFIELAQQSGINNKDLMELLVSQYELNAVGSDQQFNQDIEELQRITKRMVDLYSGMIQRTQLKEIELVNKESAIIRKKEEQIVKLEEKVEELLKKGVEMTELKDKIRSLTSNMGEIKEENDNLKEMNKLLKDKNKTLEKEASDNRVKLDAATVLQSQVAVLGATVEDQKTLISSYESRMDVLEKEKQEFIQSCENQMHEIQEKYEQKLTFEQKQNELSLNQMRMSLKEEYQTLIQDFKEEQFEKIQALINEKQELLEETHQLRLQLINNK